MNTEVLLAGGYGVLLLAGAMVLEWLSRHTHNRSQAWRTSGFDYDAQHDFWVCHKGEQLWPAEFDREKRLVRYRAKAAVCNACPAKGDCTDSNHGREITRAVDSWPHSEAGRFHRAIAVMLVLLAACELGVVLIRNHDPVEIAVLLPLLWVSVVALWWLARDLVRTPDGFPEAMPAHGNRIGRNKQT
ncbi:MAG: hypothetical protein KDB66_07480 [Solirubrobacterales bacterium]|nr:hypothetical protein [Solirubrobacterales bacterium]MCB8915879.1 hypothetical protein [Thermoleophilales bacterium]